MLVVFGGLPGTGKTTIARELAQRRSATYLRIDVIEQAIRSAGIPDLGPAGYVVAQALAAANLALGAMVVADCVNPVRASRDGWRDTAAHAASPLIEVETICSDSAEHRRRVEQRTPDIVGLLLPSWQAVLARDYHPWLEPHTILDTARLTPAQAVAIVERQIAAVAKAAPRSGS